MQPSHYILPPILPPNNLRLKTPFLKSFFPGTPVVFPDIIIRMFADCGEEKGFQFFGLEVVQGLEGVFF